MGYKNERQFCVAMAAVFTEYAASNTPRYQDVPLLSRSEVFTVELDQDAALRILGRGGRSITRLNFEPALALTRTGETGPQTSRVVRPSGAR